MIELQTLADDLGQAWGPLEEPPKLIVNRENAVFFVRLKRGPKGALRLHRAGYQTAEGIQSELLWTERLAERGFHCPTPIRTREGSLIVEQAGAPIASLVEWIDAEPVGAMDRRFGDAPQAYREVGNLIGRLHRLTDGLDTSGIIRPSWEAKALLGEAPAWGRFWENPALDPSETALLLDMRKAAEARLSQLETPDLGLIHADVLQENILRNAEGLWLIDFDDAGVGYRLYDLGTALVQHIDDPRYDLISEALADGYTAERGVSVTKADLQLFTLLRGAASCGWVMSRAAPDDPRQRVYAKRALRLARAFLA